MADDEYGVVDLAGRTHLVDKADFREVPLCGYLGDVEPAEPVQVGRYVCPSCRAVKDGVTPVRPSYYDTGGTLDV